MKKKIVKSHKIFCQPWILPYFFLLNLNLILQRERSVSQVSWLSNKSIADDQLKGCWFLPSLHLQHINLFQHQPRPHHLPAVIMKKQMEKLQVRINQNLHRTGKSVALPHELEKIGWLLVSFLSIAWTNPRNSDVQRRQCWCTSRSALPSTRSCASTSPARGRGRTASP